MHRSGEYTTEDLAEMFGVSKSTAINVASGAAWPDVHALADAMIAERNKGND